MKFSIFFSKLQEAPWYGAFLQPVLDKIDKPGKVLDIGTGSGKLLQLLVNEKGMKCTGVDTDSAMLLEAKKKLKKLPVNLQLIAPGLPLPFKQQSFDFITICSVLFHLNETMINNLLMDSLQLLTKNGKVIVLTPTGQHTLWKLSKHFFSLQNWSIYVWYKATQQRAKVWGSRQYLKHYCMKHNLSYQRHLVMHGFAQVETISR